MKYKLFCKDCNLIFDSWFSSSNEYEKLKKKKLLSCHNCNSLNIEKTLMAPKLINKNLNEKKETSIKNLKNLKNLLKNIKNL